MLLVRKIKELTASSDTVNDVVEKRCEFVAVSAIIIAGFGEHASALTIRSSIKIGALVETLILIFHGLPRAFDRGLGETELQDQLNL